MLERLRSIVLRNDTASGRFFDYFINTLIFISVACFCIDTLPDISFTGQRILRILEIIIVIIFSVEYLLRVILSKKRLKFIFSFYGIIDLGAILPFFIFTGIDLRLIRAFRFLRLFRTFQNTRYRKSISRLSLAFRLVKQDLIMFLTLIFVLIIISGAGIYYFEHAAQPEKFTSIFDSIWWAVTSLTAVGYGDMIPITAGGKIFSGIVLFIGVAIVAVPTGIFASALTRAREMEDEENKNRKRDGISGLDQNS